MRHLGKSEERKGDLRNASVLEVIIAIVIVLVVLLYDQDKTLRTQEDTLTETIIRLKAELNLAKEHSKDLAMQILNFKQRNAQLENENEVLKKEIKLLKQYVSAGKSGGEERYEELSNLIEKLQKDYLAEVDKLIQANRKIKNLEQALKGAGKGGGRDKPACVLPTLDPSIREDHDLLGKFEFESEKFSFFLNDKLDEAEARKIDGVIGLLENPSMSREIYTRYARKVLKRSQELDCRYFVQYSYREDNPAWYEKAIDDFFYKYRYSPKSPQ